MPADGSRTSSFPLGPVRLAFPDVRKTAPSKPGVCAVPSGADESRGSIARPNSVPGCNSESWYCSPYRVRPSRAGSWPTAVTGVRKINRPRSTSHEQRVSWRLGNSGKTCVPLEGHGCGILSDNERCFKRVWVGDDISHLNQSTTRQHLPISRVHVMQDDSFGGVVENRCLRRRGRSRLRPWRTGLRSPVAVWCRSGSWRQSCRCRPSCGV